MSNIAWEAVCQATAYAQAMGSSAGHLCASSLRGPLPCRLIGAWRWSPRSLNRDKLSITLLQARYTRVPTALKSKAAHQKSVPGETKSSSGAEIALQVQRRFKHQPMTTGPTNFRDNQRAKGKCRNVTNRNQSKMAASEPNSPTTASPGYLNTPEKQDLDLKSLVMVLLEECKKDINKYLKEIQENMNQKVEALTRETQKSLKEIQENRGQQIEANKEEAQKSLK